MRKGIGSLKALRARSAGAMTQTHREFESGLLPIAAFAKFTRGRCGALGYAQAARFLAGDAEEICERALEVGVQLRGPR